MFRTFVVPLDGSELAERALPYAVQLARSRRGRLVLLDVVTPPPAFDPNTEAAFNGQFHEQAVAEAEGYVAGVAGKLATRVAVETRVRVGSAAREILDEVEASHADGVIMATRSRVGPVHLVFGSVAESVLGHSSVAVFLVHAQPGEAPAAPFDPMSARLMVPLDGSPLSESALDTAVEMLGPAGEIVLTTVVVPPNTAAREYLECQAARLRREIPDIHVSFEVRGGDPARGIVSVAMNRNVDLVVMASHGRTGLGRALMGSVTGAVLRNAGVPVLVVGPTGLHPQLIGAINASPVFASMT